MRLRELGPLDPIFDEKKQTGSIEIGNTPATTMFHDRVLSFTSPLNFWRMNDASSPVLDEMHPSISNWDGVASGSTILYQQAPLRVDLAQCVRVSSTGHFECSQGSVGGTLSFTVWAWVQTTSTARQVVIQQRDALAFHGEWGIELGDGADVGRVRVYGFNTLGVFEFDFFSDTTVNDGSPHLIGFSADQVADETYLYVDGVLSGNAGNLGGLYDNSLNIAIGRDVRDNLHNFDGYLSEIGIDLSAWTAAQWLYAYDGTA